ncbi:hypothetical protein P3X46_031499 [Hevea brasiliensis]|uniref:At1g68980-like TPR repeats domain-containing protein n=1 Tax=Hevea brasiliensis TaxID=3981 RepID=A0ABQ9KLV4_HEVBR|nr:pentatricopeptide repeat-containing protein At4g17616 [Hevea brasiliensis]XP_057995140.1 pentatricopeptide repeat-containing protein At4g17616 [Hevea brasiliensis]KAJ9140907.1 hypothetical protein P3X46_031499 [Hevea brasiliensis]
MALISTRKVFLKPCIVKSCLHGFVMASANQKTALISYHGGELLVEKSFRRFQVINVFCKQNQFVNFKPFSSSTKPESIGWEVSSHAVLLRKLEVSLEYHQVDEAWVTFNDFKSLYGFPRDSLVSRLITELSYSSDPHWLQKACTLVLEILKEKSSLLKTEILTKLALSLARAQMPIPASIILRVMLERENMPPVSVLQLIVLHMVKSEIGTYLASNFLIQICDYVLRLSEKRSELKKMMKPDTMIFNLVLDACVRFKSYLKGQEILEWMSQTNVIADAHSIIIISQIYEINGLRDEIKKLKDHIDRVSAAFVCHYQRFYDCLLNLHFKFDDLDAAAKLLLDMNGSWGSIPSKKTREEMQKPYLVSIGSQNLRAGLKIQIVPELLQKDSVIKVEDKTELVIFKNGKLLPTNRALAKLIHCYKRDQRIAKLSKVLLSMQKDFQTLGESNLCSDVIDACIRLGWLETAHDVLENTEAAGFPVGLTAYMSLLTAYYSQGMFKEAEALLRQIRKAGLVSNLSGEIVASAGLLETTGNMSSSVSESDLADFLVEEVREEEKVIPSMIYKLNASIYFFCKAKMMGDALRTYRRMQMMGIQPTVQTFSFLIYGYSSLQRYRDITVLWGDIKRSMKSRNIVLSRDLYELLLMNFIRGGYFERVTEVVGYMKEHNMYTDKWMYKSEFLKLHKNLYKGVKASEARNEVQRKRLEFVQTFRKWVDID